MHKKVFTFLILIFLSFSINAQDNSPGLNLDVVDKVPVAKDCDSDLDNRALRICYGKSVQKTVMNRVDINFIKRQNLEPGLYTAIAKFRVNTKGKIDKITVDFENEKIAKHIKRAVKKLRRSEPAIKDGEPVNIIYALPVKFRI
ncbi:energy transducer TonB [Zunongwangia endophytica]|uniref:Energy transducer TonB n=1 Tax=Zunongwangia endophytica TaxID=1808945 RepID=A0ABV8HCX4_9FLAO|nr:energy transducer TonB [Zunongwangia endophytica]MDN3594010.1 energy transducer TonB [Zunongwangia endophytica]